MGAMENAGARHHRRGVRLPLQGHRGPRRAARPHRAARAGPHVVRRPRDDALVERPLAQRVLRRVGLDDLPGRGHRVDRRVDDLRHLREGLGLPPGPAGLDPPDRRRDQRPRGRRGQLRRHHLRQGRLGAQAAGRLRRPGAFRDGIRAYFAKHAWGNTTLEDLLVELEATSGRDLRSWSAAWLETAGVNTLRPWSRSTTAAGSRRRWSSRPRRRASRPCARTGSASASTTSSRAACTGATARARRRRRAHRGPASCVGRQQPDLLLVNDDDLAYAKIRLDERSLATALATPAASRPRCPAPSCSPRRGT